MKPKIYIKLLSYLSIYVDWRGGVKKEEVLTPCEVGSCIIPTGSLDVQGWRWNDL